MSVGSEQVAWVHGGDSEVGRAIALRLAAGGARVLVTGANERALGACVGEIAHGGGKGRHFVGGVATEAAITACAEAAVARFGKVDVAVVVGSPDDALRVVGVARVRAIAAPEANGAGDSEAIAARIAAEIASG